MLKRAEAKACDFCAPYNCTHRRAGCGPQRIWPLIWMMYDAGRLVGAEPTLPRCQHGDWNRRKDRCCLAVQAGGGIFRPGRMAPMRVPKVIERMNEIAQ
jgi:hypothetical protein